MQLLTASRLDVLACISNVKRRAIQGPQKLDQCSLVVGGGHFNRWKTLVNALLQDARTPADAGWHVSAANRGAGPRGGGGTVRGLLSLCCVGGVPGGWDPPAQAAGQAAPAPWANLRRRQEVRIRLMSCDTSCDLLSLVGCMTPSCGPYVGEHASIES